MDSYIRFIVPGIPVPQGSKTAGVTRDGVPFMRDANKGLHSWRVDVVNAAREALRGAPPIQGAVRLGCKFTFPYLKKHFNYKGELKGHAPWYKTSKPDLDKLVRGVMDALKIAGVIRDDAQVVEFMDVFKEYGYKPGLICEVRTLEV